MPIIKKIIGITIGDIAGIGPEVAIKALRSNNISPLFTPILIGPREIWNSYGAAKLNFTIVDVPFKKRGRYVFGAPSRIGGEIAYDSLSTGIKLAQENMIDALVTAPLSKKSLYLAGFGFNGYTEILARKCKVKNFSMLMTSYKIFSLIITRHKPFKDVSKGLKIKDIVAQTAQCAQFIKDKVLKRKVRIAVSSLNPHSGEDGLLGNEEEKIIKPAVVQLRKKGLSAEGPIASDHTFPLALSGKFDLIVNHYHDQSMIPLKLISKGKIVNITVGLPFLRTSPGHGVAFNIAGQDACDPTGMIAAINFAANYS
ncbi:MAG: 4-hydroxythreonine-4-phosphate dehydrogenase PdxA [bacterium]